MCSMVFELLQHALQIRGDVWLFPVRRIYCAGRNCADQAREMGHAPTLEQPFFFFNPADALVAAPADIAYPQRTRDVQHEVELVVALKSSARNLTAEQARHCIFG